MTTSAINPLQCRYCGHHHQNVCPMVKAIEYFEDGSVRRVEFKTHADYYPMTVPTGMWPPVTPQAPTKLQTTATGAFPGPEH